MLERVKRSKGKRKTEQRTKQKNKNNKKHMYLYKASFRYEAKTIAVNSSPLMGPTRGGTLVTIDGANFNMQAFTFCRFGAMPVAVNFASSPSAARLQCVSPAMPDGFSPLMLISNDQNYMDDGLSFEHVRWPDLLTILPSQGPVLGGTHTIIAGDHFNERAAQLNYLFCKFNWFYFMLFNVSLCTEKLCRK